jgi:hypothetical protein
VKKNSFKIIIFPRRVNYIFHKLSGNTKDVQFQLCMPHIPPILGSATGGTTTDMDIDVPNMPVYGPFLPTPPRNHTDELETPGETGGPQGCIANIEVILQSRSSSPTYSRHSQISQLREPQDSRQYRTTRSGSPARVSQPSYSHLSFISSLLDVID